VIGCDCHVCKSGDPRNNRTRASILVESRGQRLLVDVPPDFRTQALRENLRSVDAVLITHDHADHICGLDDLRIFGFYTGQPMRIYSSAEVKQFIENRFFYAFDPPQTGGGVPALDLRVIDAPMTLGDVRVTPVPVFHGRLPILGFRFNDFGYITDCRTLPDESKRALLGVKALILNALRHKPHSTHLSLMQAVDLAREIGAQQTFFTHMAHDLEHEETNRLLPPSIQLAYDGLRISIEDGSDPD
jgi:phosphoribosyl 1,2-cyclic phosphate phosphodiesterase